MKNLISIIILTALLLPCGAFAQVRLEDGVLPLLDATLPVTTSAEGTSKVVGPSSELKTVEWMVDAVDAAFTGTVKVYQANDKGGPFVQWVSKMSGVSSPNITMTRKWFGNLVTAPRSLSTQFGLLNSNGTPCVVNRWTALRRFVSQANDRSAAVDQEVPVQLYPAGTVFTSTELLSEPFANPGQLKSLDWNNGPAGATSNITLTVYVSELKAGPFKRWTPAGTTTQFTLDDKRQGTDIVWPDAAWGVVGVDNDSGGNLTCARMTALRLRQRAR